MSPAPFLPDDLQVAVDRVMRGAPPLALFATVGRDPRLLRKMLYAGLLEPGNLSVRHREIVIHRTTALNGADYEFGVHAAHFAPLADLDRPALASLAQPQPVNTYPWSDVERLLLDLCDTLHHTSCIDDDLWTALSRHFSDEALIELLMLAGYYRMISYLCNGLALPLEPGTRPLPGSAHQHEA